MMSQNRELVNREEEEDSANVIDYVLVYRLSSLNEAQQLKLLLYERTLLQTGLTLRLERYKGLSFVKVTVSKDTLYQYAELLRLRMPIKLDNDLIMPSQEEIMNRFFSFLSIYKSEKTYKLCAEFSRDKLYLFEENDPDFFNKSARITIAAYIISRASFGEAGSSGVKQLILEKVFLNAYPLHDGTMDTKDSVRYRLMKNWASMRCWYKSQPLDELRDYFGSSVALYFTWMGFYNTMLIPASIGGVITIIIGLSMMDRDGFANDMCTYNVTMCPLCDNYCPYWNLRSRCNFSRWAYLSDNFSTLFFSILMSMWNILYLVMWKRHMARVTYNWGLANYHISAEPTRPEYLSRLRNIKTKRLNVLTLTPEPDMPFWTMRFPILVFSFTLISLWVFVAIFMYLCLIFYQLQVSRLSIEQHLKSSDIYLTACVTFVNLILIYILYFVYKKCAIWLTKIELHRTTTQHEDSFFLKLYAFQFVTHYTPVFYIAFVKGNIVGTPGNYIRILGVREKQCVGAGCLVEVMEYIAITMTAKQAFFLIASRYLPVIMIYKLQFRVIFNYIFRGKEPLHYNQVIDDYILLPFGTRELYEAYLQMVLQFGFVSMFVNAFPLSHAFALLYNTMRIRVDAIRILKYHKRPVPKIVKDVGLWMKIVYFVTHLSVFTNAFMIATSPRFIPRIIFYLEGICTRSGKGYLLQTLSKFDTRDLESGTVEYCHHFNQSSEKYCYYFGFMEPPESKHRYTYTTIHWKVSAGKLSFIIGYYVIANMLITLVEWIIPKVPNKIQEKIQIENYHINRAIIKKEKKDL